MRRLIREGDPPAGQLASPVPQYWNPNTEAFEDVLGAHGAPRAILYGYGLNGQPISTANRLPVEATLTGSNVQPEVVEITNTPLAAGGQFIAPDVDLTQAPGIGLLGYVVAADQPTRLRIQFGDEVDFAHPAAPQVD